MKAFRRREVTDLQQLRALVADNTDAMEPNLTILASNFNLGRTTVELAALDADRVPVLFVLGLTADDAMLVRALEAYAWCLEYPESVQQLVPKNTELGWPPRIVFVAERLLEAFVRKMRLLSFSSVECFEFRYVEANGTTGFYLNRVDWAPSAGVEKAPAPRLERSEPRAVERAIEEENEDVAPALEEPRVAPREDPRLVLLREEPQEEPQEELEDPREEELRVAPREEPRVVPLVPVEEPRIVMLHETRPAPPPEPAIEPPPTKTNGATGGGSDRVERGPAVLKGLRPPTEAPPRRRSREVPDLLRPSDARPSSPREMPRSPAARPASPAPPAPAAARGSSAAPKTPAPPAPRAPEPPAERPKTEPSRVDLPRNGGAKSDVARADVPKGDLAPTWRKFLDRLTSTFDTRPTSGSELPRTSAPPLPASPSPSPLAIQPFAADIEVPGAEVAPAEEAVEESNDGDAEPTDKQRRALQGLTLPDNGELAPQWRKFLDRPTLDETKIDVVRRYLQREFPLCTVYDFYDFQRNAQVFQLQDNHGKVTQLITMTAEFFDGHRDLEIRAWIEKHRVAQAMRQAGQAGVLISQAGLQIEAR